MTVIVLSILGCAWVGYFAYCFKDNRGAVPQRRSGLEAFSHSLSALGGPDVDTGRPSLASNSNAARYGMLIEPPRTPDEASQRRKYVIISLAAVSLISLVSVPTVGVAGWAMHSFANAALLGYICMAIHLKHRSAEHEMRAMLLHRDLPAMQQSATVPARHHTVIR